MKSMRTVAWYNYVVASGVILNSIPIKTRDINGKKADRRWNHWKNGEGTVEIEDLIATEKKVANSRVVYEIGPECQPLWAAIDADTSWSLNGYPELSTYKSSELTNINSNFYRFNPYLEDTDILNPYEPDTVKVIKLETKCKLLTHKCLKYRIKRDSIFYNSHIKLGSDGKDPVTQFTELSDLDSDLEKTLDFCSDLLAKYGLRKEDIIYYLRLLNKEPREIIKFKDRFKHPLSQSFKTKVSFEY